MKISVFGLWHLGSVVSACLASKEHTVVGVDSDPKIVKLMSNGKAPIYEPNLNELIQDRLEKKYLKFMDISSQAFKDTEIVWITHDTPVNDDDIADVDYVINQIKLILPLIKKGTLILISSQLPIGTIKFLEEYTEKHFSKNDIRFACSPENLRLGQAINIFENPDRIIVGVRHIEDKIKLFELISPITKNIVWMGIESAEMTKHAINAFLATSITFTNEIASLCEATGANAKEVEQGLKTEVRIGQRAYVSPGGAFSGGTLARDINFLNDIGKQIDLSIPVLSSVRLSNDEHKKWVRRKLKAHFGSLRGKKISVLGLTYKPGTDTLRRSASVELCNWILLMGGQINVYDPVVKKMPQSWGRNVRICSSAIDTLKNSDALIIGTEWPEFKKINFNFSFPKNRSFPIFDANCFLKSLSDNENIKYYSVGIPIILKDNK